jgi:hypothetical protein
MAQKYLGRKERKELQLNTLNEAELNTELSKQICRREKSNAFLPYV